MTRSPSHEPDRPLPKCGAERSAGICPRCLIRLGIDRAGQGDATTPPGGVLDSIAATIGKVPRVLLRDTAPGEEPGPIVRPRAGDGPADSAIRYRIDGEIARGGMGAVLRGRDPDLGRDVALTILCEILTGDPAFLGRSSGEILRKAALGDLADAAARLDACEADAELIAIARDCLARELEDRPRRAEEAVHTAAEADERARVERRARRFQVGLAASLLVLVTAGGLGGTYLLQQRQQRAERAAQVLAEATALRDRAARAAGDPAAWRDALAALERA